MSNDSGSKLPPFPSSYRASGLLLHVTSLPSPYGIGEGAKSFVGSWNELIGVIASKSATLATVG